MKSNLFKVILAIILTIAIVIVIILFGQGKLFQGALYNLRPIYSSCKIEGNNFNSDKTEDCEKFYEKFQEGYFPDGEYTIFAQYTDKKLNNNIIPIKIAGKNLTCNFLENGYKLQAQSFDPATPHITQKINTDTEIPVLENGTAIRINYLKNDQIYHYDDNICEAAFSGEIMDSNKNILGTVKLDTNGFINSRPNVNEILVTNQIYYTNEKNQNIKQMQPGNLYLSINPLAGQLFKFTIPCSSYIPKISLPTISTSTDLNLKFEGLTEDYMSACSNRLYLSLQNTNKYDDIQKIENLNLNGENPSYLLKLSEIDRLKDSNTVYPISFKINLHLRDRADNNQVFTLGSGILTVNSYKAEQSNNSINSADITPIKELPITAELQQTAEIRTKVRRS